ncbi:TPA: hypothetical protein ACTWZ9_000174 [Raoultella planticola]|uniref:hypothetical protein n=1 Tax=Raoultella planticola TaxID=575 RepID=UPI000937674C|nr:hypothetical protein [Raoultella planticola]RNN90756.1 hypothetical protein BL127_00025190 [Raoultella planticola]
MHLYGSVVKDNQAIPDAVTLVMDLKVNDNGILFIAASYTEDFDEIEPGCTIPFRSWGYFCARSGADDVETAYNYLLGMDEFSGQSIRE